MILDSNVLIYFVDPAYEYLRNYLDDQPFQVFVSLITKLEVLGYYKLNMSDKMELERLLAAASIYPISTEIIPEAIRLRQQRKRFLADSIIAATEIVYNQPVLTNNVADFTDIEGLRVIPLADSLSA